MNLYDLILNKIRKIQEPGDKEPVTNISTSSILTAEITLISSILVIMIMLRLVNTVLMIIALLVVLAIISVATPLIPRFKKEQNDSFASMIFYIILALAIVITLFYWGSYNV